MVKIKEIPINERPRERLINFGVDKLSNEELISIIIKTGTKNISVKELSLNILKELDNISELKNIKLENLTKIKGIKEAKACELLASIELGKRIQRKNDNVKKIKIVEAKNIYEYYFNLLENKKQEYFYCVYLDTKNQIIKDKLLYVGTVNQSLIHPREIFKEACLLSSTSFICLHNHPSGNSNPSNDDIKMTKILKEASEVMGIKLLDHIIIGENYFSFTEHGMI